MSIGILIWRLFVDFVGAVFIYVGLSAELEKRGDKSSPTLSTFLWAFVACALAGVAMAMVRVQQVDGFNALKIGCLATAASEHSNPIQGLAEWGRGLISIHFRYWYEAFAITMAPTLLLLRRRLFSHEDEGSASGSESREG
jgi:hypothetical protein